MRIYQSKCGKLSGTNFSEVARDARAVLRKLTTKTRRRPHVRSAYFKKSKIFIGPFFAHTHEKSWQDAVRRMKLFPCAIDLVKNSRYEPLSKQDPNNPHIMLHRFGGATRQKELFYVQIKEDKRTGNKYFMSCFPPE